MTLKRGPWVKWYWSDWRSDPKLRMCSIAARGLWAEMLALMQEGVPYGHLLISGRAPTDAQLAVLAGMPADHLPELLGELEAADVFSRTRADVIYSRRMVRDEKKARTAQKNGKDGGNPSLCKNKEISSSDNQQDNQRDKPQKLDTRSHKEKDISLESDFPDWYAAYPRHVGRGQAERAYVTARKAADAETLISAARSFAEQSRSQDPKFIPHPATWLNGQRWLDVPDGDAAQIGEGGGRDPATFSFDDWANRVSVALKDGPWPETYGPHPKTGKTQNVAALAKYYLGQFHKDQEKVA